MLIFDIFSCYWHGCTKCFLPNSFNHQKQKLFCTLNKETKNRISEIESSSYTVKQIWECEFNKMKKQSIELNDFIKNDCKISAPLNPRDSLFGGRTNSLKLFHECEIGERIMYVDYKSLYPSIQKTGIFPVGHPEIITENFEPIENYFGLIKCNITAPKRLLIPVLPVRVDGKLIFLCVDLSPK